jgi:hypothetical protein
MDESPQRADLPITVTHEIRTALTVALASFQLAGRALTSADAERADIHLAVAERAIRRAALAINGVLPSP